MVSQRKLLFFLCQKQWQIKRNENELANMQCNLTVAFQTAGWRFSQTLYSHILTVGLLDYPTGFLDERSDRVSQSAKSNPRYAVCNDKSK